MKEKLAKLAELLLDTGKRNNLINFRDNKSNTVEIVAPSFDAVAKKLSGNYVFEVFDPKLDLEEERGKLTDAKLKEILKNKWDYVSRYESKLTKSCHALVYNCATTPIKALKNVEKRWRSAIDETGVNIAYLAIGFISWNEEDKPNEKYLAPLLLAPISLAKKSNVDPYRISVYADDMIINPTFAYKLQSEYNIDLPEYDEDDEGGLIGYLTRISEVVGKLKWQVEKVCKIGLFSFLKINMYRDLKDNADLIVQNNNVKKMLGETISPNAAKEKVEARFNVVDADSSQLKAIEMAKAGESFVLQGPPGTGKSQTITNIIAECIADGKKVLFVSEKLAALNVVYNKLKQAGLEDFCLQLHSHKANKKDFIQELCRTMRLEKSGVSAKAAQEVDRLNKSHTILDNYVEVLHTRNEIIDKSLFELIEEVCACKNSVELEYFVKDIESKGERYVATVVDMLEQYVEYSAYIGYNYKNHVWYGYADKDASMQRKFYVKKSIGRIKDVCQDAEDLANAIYVELEIADFANFDKVEQYGKFFELLSNSKYISTKLFDGGRAQSVAEKASQLRMLFDKEKELRKTLTNDFSESIFKLNGKASQETFVRNGGIISRLCNKEYKACMAQIKACSKSGKVSYKKALDAMGTLQEYQERVERFNSQDEILKKYLSKAYEGIHSDWNLLERELKQLIQILGDIKDFGSLKIKSDDNITELRTRFSEYADKCFEITKRVEDENDVISSFDKSAFDIKSCQFDYLFTRLCNCFDDVDSLDNWIRFSVVFDKLKELDVLEYVDVAISKSVAIEDFIDVFKRIFYMQWIDEIIKKDEFLQAMTRVTHDRTVDIFCDKDVRNFEISKAKIRSALSALRPDLEFVAPGSAVANLLNEGNKKRRLKSIRVLLEEIRELAQTLKPCFLMSPLSVSTYLTQEIKFDVVIFDEASQIFPQDAIGAIYRGKQVIVVGDSKQMPPSNFFMAIADSDEFDDNDDVDVKDFESVLDLCATVLPQLRLKWHYRSRYESLIDFSNKQFYDSDLVTFPSSKVDRGGDGIGVDFHFVEGGTFDHKSRTNRAEAEYIVDLVFDNIEKYPERSLGVVAFSISQQDLIESLIAKRRSADPSKEEFFSMDNAEPFFVKNLETVQGDERDTIIFSIAYAKDKDGKMSHNFGPINKMGGERRLNVAITRAKLNVQLVSSIHGGDIDAKKVSSVGAKLLKEYINYAENGVYASAPIGAGDNDGMFEFEMEVAEFLRSKGYDVDTKIGASAANVDLGVRLPNGDDYILAVECDGRAYKNANNTRDRDRLRSTVLQRMGWHYHRVWAIDWIKNKKDEKERLLQALKNALEFPPEYDENSVEIDDLEGFEETVDRSSYQFPTYAVADIEKAKVVAGADYLMYVRKVLEKEAPLSEEFFLKRTIRDFSREKLTDAVWDKFGRLMSRCQAEGIVRKDGFMYIKNRRVDFRLPSDDFVRELKFISLEELAVGMSAIIRKNVSVERMGLYKLIAKLLGFSKLGEAMVKRFDEALELIKDDIDVEGEVLSIKG